MVGSWRARALLAAAAAAALGAYVVVVDLGISAGRIHPGVEVAGIEVGGLTESEAAAKLRSAAVELRHRPIFFVRDRLTLWIAPRDIGWRPRVDATVDSAMEVGRGGGAVGALSERASAWLSGVELPFAGKPAPHKVKALLLRWEERARAEGLRINRGKLRYKLRRAVRRWPEGPFRIPVAG